MAEQTEGVMITWYVVFCSLKTFVDGRIFFMTVFFFSRVLSDEQMMEYIKFLNDGKDGDDRDWLPPSGSAWCGTRHGGSEAAC